MLYTEINVVYSENHTSHTHINGLYGEATNYFLGSFR